MNTNNKQLEAAKGWYKIAKEQNNNVAIEILENIFTELAESEDEKLRKEMLQIAEESEDSFYMVMTPDKRKRLIAWLEKQGEQKSIDDLTQQEAMDIAVAKCFEQGDHNALTEFERTLADICIGWIGEEYGWKQYIKDNADVLLKIAIKKFNSVQDAPFEQKSAIKLERDDNGEPVLTPFEAELFSMVSEAWQGYSLGEEVNIAQIVKEHSSELIERANEQKSAWSEEDEDILNLVIARLHSHTNVEFEEYSKEYNWLNSLEERYTWKPSDEQMNALQTAIGIVGELTPTASLLKEIREQLKKLK